MFSHPLAIGAIVFLMCVITGVLPLCMKFGERFLHAVIAGACGLFLGITFLHLLPELAERDPSPRLWAFVLVGLLAVFLAEVLLRAEHVEGKNDGHRVLGLATFFGLTLHSLGGALGLGLGFDDPKLREVFLWATLSHKAAEAFSLTSVLLLAGLRRRQILFLLVAYSLVTPAGLMLGRAFAGQIDLSGRALGAAEGLAAGTFLYVALCELLPEVFHGRSDRLLKVALLGAGIAASTALLFVPH